MNLKKNGERVFQLKYSTQKTRTWNQTCWRVASYIANAEKAFGKTDEEILEISKKYFTIIYDLYFLPGGRILANSGTDIKNLLNCFVGDIQDSRSSIFGALRDAAEIFASGGGLGFNYSNIREEGAKIKMTGGKASGPLSFMSLFDQTGEVIQQASRRGAQIGILDIDHPDIENFIDHKSALNNRNKRLISEFKRNLSNNVNEQKIKVLEKTLMDDQLTHMNISVLLNDDFISSVLQDLDWNLLSRVDNSTVKSVKAKSLIKKIADRCWISGDPGVLFYNRINEDNMVPYLGDIKATNPCVTGDAKILTVYDGPQSFKDLVGKDTLVYAWNPDTKLPVIRMMRNPRKTREDAELVEVLFDSGLKIKCTPDHCFYTFRGNKVKAKDLKMGQSIRAFSMSQHRDGHLRVHGWVNGKAKHQYVARLVWECFNGKVPEKYILHHKDFNKLNNRIENFQLLTNSTHNAVHYPYRVDGGFFHRNHKIISITSLDQKEDVYNGTVDDVHTYIIVDDTPVSGIYSGIVSANCGEVPLLEWEACNLGSINLKKFVDPITKKIDWPLLEETIRLSIRFLDDVQEVSEAPLEKINEMNKGLRRLGLGVLGFADLLASLEIPYDSEEALKLANYLSWFISFFSWQESMELAKERGPFGYYDSERVNLSVVEKVLNSKYNPYKFDMEEVRRRGLRNVSVTSIAPTGSISIIAGVNSGIEPFFALAYKRNITEGIGNTAKETLIEINPMLFEKLQEYNISEDEIGKIKKWILERGSIQDYPQLPDKLKKAFKIADEISWVNHIDMQSQWQEYISNAISKTINCKESTTKDEMQEMYLYGWNKKLKGLTIYRNNSKLFQILNIGVGEKELSEAKEKKIDVDFSGE